MDNPPLRIPMGKSYLSSGLSEYILTIIPSESRSGPSAMKSFDPLEAPLEEVVEEGEEVFVWVLR